MTKEKITVILYIHTHAQFKHSRNWQRKGHVMRRSCNKTIINVYSWMNISLLFSLSFVSFRMLISAIPCQPHMLPSSFSLHTISYISWDFTGSFVQADGFFLLVFFDFWMRVFFCFFTCHSFIDFLYNLCMHFIKMELLTHSQFFQWSYRFSFWIFRPNFFRFRFFD